MVSLYGKFLINYNDIHKNNYNSYLSEIDINTLKSKEILKKSYTINKNNLLTGELIVYCGGFKDDYVYQVIQYDNEEFQTGGTSKLYYYNDTFKEKHVEVSFNSDNIYSFVCGDKDNLIVSDYHYERPQNETGSFYELIDKNYIENIIPNIRTTNDILDCKQLSNKIIITSLNYVSIYDLENRDYSEINIENASSNVKFYKNSFGYLEENKDKLIFKLFEIK